MIFKGYLAYWSWGDAAGFSLAASSGSNFLTVILLCVTMYYVARSRNRYYEQLMSSATKRTGRESLGASKVARTQCRKLLAMHYHLDLDDDNNVRWVWMKQYLEKAQSSITGCHSCGRSPVDVEEAATTARLKR